MTLDELNAKYGKPVTAQSSSFANRWSTPEKRSFMEKVAGFTGGEKIAQGLGQAIANPEIAKQQEEQLNVALKQQNELLKKKKEITDLGGDTSHVDKGLALNKQTLEQISGGIEGLLNQKKITDKQVYGDALQLGTTVLGAGTYGKGATAGMQGGKLAIQGRASQAIGNLLPNALKTTTEKALPSAVAGLTESVGIAKGAIQGAKSGAIAGGIYGTSSGVSNALKQDKSIGDIALGGLKGGLTGAATGGVIGGVVGGITGYRNIKKATDTTVNNHLTSAKQEIQNLSPEEIDKLGGTKKLFEQNRKDIVDQLRSQELNHQADLIESTNVSNVSDVNKYESLIKSKLSKPDFVDKLITPSVEKGKTGLAAIKSGKVVEGKGILGERNFSSALPNYDNVKESVTKVPGLSSKNSSLENLNLIHDTIGTTAQDLRAQLKSSGVSFTPAEFNKYMQGIKTNLAENPTIVGDAEKTASKIIDKFNSLVKENGYTPEGLLNARQALDGWMGSQKANVFNPNVEGAVSTSLRAIRQGGNKFLAKLVPDVAVKDLLAHQTNLYDAIDIIAPKAQKEGASYLSRLVGLVRAHPVGALATTGATAIVGDRVIRAIVP